MKKLLIIIKNEINSYLQALVIFFPDSSLGNQIRKFFWQKKLNCNNVYFGRGAYISSSDKLKVGENLSFGHNVCIENHNSFGCYIGSNVGMARGTYIRTANHNFSDPDKNWMAQGHNAQKILANDGDFFSVIINDDVWIGANCNILSGANIGKGSIISAGSVVSGEIPEFSIAVGNPARVIGKRSFKV